MAVTKQAYYEGDSPKIPAPPGYSAVTPHDANISHRPFQAPSGDDGTGTGIPSDGFASTDNVKVTRLANDVSDPAGQAAANAAFDSAAAQRRPEGSGMPRGEEPSPLRF